MLNWVPCALFLGAAYVVKARGGRGVLVMLAMGVGVVWLRGFGGVGGCWWCWPWGWGVVRGTVVAGMVGGWVGVSESGFYVCGDGERGLRGFGGHVVCWGVCSGCVGG